MDKLELQSTCFDNIKTLCVNYRKDSSTRKSVEYLNKRLSSLESYWKEFDNRHPLLVIEIENKNLHYFTDDVYGKTKDMYLATKADINARLSEGSYQKQNVEFDLSGTLDSNDFAETGDKIQLLLNKQECNFNAMFRTITKISTAPCTEKWELDDYLSSLKAKWDPIDKLHWQIDFHLKGSKEDYYDIFSDIEQKYEDLKRKISAKIWSNAHYQTSAPKIKLPEFSGNFKQWISFKDLFLESIDKNPSINNAQKMQHLKSKLRGEAERLVQHLSISADNYESCWDILSQRYDNLRLQFNAYVNTMMDLPVIQQPDAFKLKRLHDVITECMNGISNLGVEISSWDPLIILLMAKKLDSTTLSDYSKLIQPKKDLPKLSEFLAFLENQFMAFETMKSTKKTDFTSSTNNEKLLKQTQMKKPTYTSNKSYNYYAVPNKCPHCGENHVLRQCDKFLSMDLEKRNDTVANLQLCKNCLYSHGNGNCKSTKTCRECNLKHHTLLHNKNEHSNYKRNTIEQRPTTSSSSKQLSSNHLQGNDTQVLLTTVQLKVKSVDGTYKILRALLDQGSQANLITENAAQLLRLPRQKINASVSGIGTLSGECRGQIQLSCKSIHSDYSFETTALIMIKLTNRLPTRTFQKEDWPHLKNLKLADPEFNISGPIDLLLGAGIYSEIIMEGILRGNIQSPVAQQTQIGWILCGKTETLSCNITMLNMQDLTKFWQTEDIQNSKDIPNDDICENYYKKTVQRLTDGRYIVKMPIFTNLSQKLGKSKSIAVSQFLQQEKRMQRKENLSKMYKEFMKEYEELGHMKPSPLGSTMTSCYLPHHGVLREGSVTTKLRVVFNASQKTSNGCSLNSLMEKGPNLQKDIQALIIKWRTYRYAFTADIEKMYRCIMISEEQQHLQKIIWRSSADAPLRDYQLCTVTYGTKAAPWLAMRTLKQLAIDDGAMYPEAAKTLQTECYVDDIISGHNSIPEAQTLIQSLTRLLKGAQMNLHKWISNHKSLLENIDEERISSQHNFEFKSEELFKTLGLIWNPTSDTFTFNWPMNNSTKLTKRSLLSDISKFYDPLGWLSPVTVKAKLLFQRLWLSKVHWDDAVPSDIQTEWLQLRGELHLINTMTVNRWIGHTQQRVELLGFCDASEKAYACVIYCRVMDDNNKPTISLLVARTRVAPITQKPSLPRLELCGALLLADLMEKTKEVLSDYNIQIKAWSDSQVVLAWIQGEPSRWEAYVTNRVTKIKRIIPATSWNYIKSELNPADCASRGLSPCKLQNYKLWWQGPDLLLKQECSKPIQYETNIGCTYHTEVKNITLKHNNQHFINMLLNKSSSLTYTIRVVAWIQRFIKNLRGKVMKSDSAYLTASELGAAKTSVVRQVQRSEFNHEYNELLTNGTLSKKSPIYKLNPYINNDGLIVVGGRLNNSCLPLKMKNPAIIPHKSRFTELLITQAHLTTLHGGARLTLMYIRQQYWIIGGNRSVKTQLRKCVRCHRFSKTDTHQLMGDLPQERITPCRPFTHTGVDFSGYVDVKLSKGRGVKSSKGYIAIFICMTTKAVHIELVSDLSAATFIAAFQRLCARRGVPKHMYSDCGTNFVGASKMLRQEFEKFKEILSPTFFNELAHLEVNWHFNAPAWPSAGGLWEAAVKSMKHHLRRVLGDQKLTYEEFSTLLAKIEACLNSRPLYPLTEDPDEYYNCLTPGHFLTGSSILSLPLSDYNDVNKIDLRQRWHLIENMFQRYWKTWSNEYLTTLQARSKWNKSTKNIKEGDIVLVKEDNLPPGKWALGRVLQTHPGTDGLVRVTTLKTAAGTIKRPIVKLSPLPIPSENTEDADNKKPQQNYQKTSNKLINSLLLITLVMFTLVSGSHSNVIERAHDKPGAGSQITSLQAGRPIYYDTVGTLQTIHDEWILIMFYNLTNYWEANQRIENYIENIKQICNQANLLHCRTTVNQLEHEVELLRYYNTVLIKPQKHLSSRKKRGLIDGVGYIANSLFGVLDQRFAEKYETDIQCLQNNENYLLDLIKNQTTIVELENQVLKQTEANIKKQIQFIDSFINQTNQNIRSLETEIEILSATTYVNSASLTAYLLINNLRTFQEMLFNTLTNIYQGHIDVHLITPVHLIQQVNEITGSLPKTLSLPVQNYKENIKELYKLITVKARVTQNFFLFEAHIPLVSDEDYTLHRAMPLPMNTSNGIIIVRTSSQYIAVNLKKNIYISITEEDLKQCVQQKSNNYLCMTNLPTYDLNSKTAPCEAKLLSHQNKLPCDVDHTSCKDAWIQLHSPNSWLATCCTTCTLRTICNDDITTQTIMSSSIVTVVPGCVLQSYDLTIYSHLQYHSRSKMDFEFSVPTLETSINNVVNMTAPVIQKTLQTKTIDWELAQIEQKIAFQKSKEVQHLTISSHDVHQYIISYGLLATAVITVLVVVGRKYCCGTPRYSPKIITTEPRNDIELQDLSTRTRELPNQTEDYSDSQQTTQIRNYATGKKNIAFNFD